MAGGIYNKALSNWATSMSGFRNKVSGRFSTITGGSKNTVNGRFGFAAGFSGKITSDYSATFSFDGDSCQVRDDYSFGVCATAMLIRDSGGTWNDVMDLFDSRARHLAAADEHTKSVAELAKAQDEHAKLDGHFDEMVEAVAKRADAVAGQLAGLDYDASLKQVEALLAGLSR